jgi:hypothetical protein
MSTPATLTTAARARVSVPAAREVTLLDLLDRLLAGGIVIQADVTLAVADIDLVNLSLSALVASVDSLGRGLQRSSRELEAGVLGAIDRPRGERPGRPGAPEAR